jgi:hypothetical protein
MCEIKSPSNQSFIDKVEAPKLQIKSKNKIQLHVLSKTHMQKLNGSEELVIIKCHDLFL